MRVFIPAKVTDLSSGEPLMGHAHAVTGALRSAFPEEDDEMLDMIATLAAADMSLMMDNGAPSRLIIAADAQAVPEGEPETSVRLTAPVFPDDYVALFADEAAAAEWVTRARAGDEEARHHLEDADLLWYHPDEAAALIEELSARSS